MLVEFIIPTYNRPAPLTSMLASLIAQTDGDWGAHVMIDGSDHASKIIEVINMFGDGRIRYTVTERRYNDFGHTPREMGKQASVADYIIMTGDDNYYTPNFVREIRPFCAQNAIMIYWDMVHSHYQYSYFECSPIMERIDMGAFATRRDVAQQIPLGVSYAADGHFVNKIKELFPEEPLPKIEKVLFVHN